jgi:IS30 family transposase
VVLGRPKGKAQQLKLDSKRDEIEKYMTMGLSLRKIAKLIDEAPSTVSDYVKVRLSK